MIWWEGDDDPENPYNWPAWRTRTTAVVLTAMAFLIPLASCKTLSTQVLTKNIRLI